MFEKIKKNQRTLMTMLIVICMGIIAFSEYRYLSTLRDRLESNELRHIRDMAQIQKKAVDDYIAADRDRLHTCAEYFSKTPAYTTVGEMLRPFVDPGAVDYGIVCFDEGLAFSTLSNEVVQMTEAQMAEYSSLTGSGVRDIFTGIFSGEQRFSYYENFTFANGHHGLIQKSYDRSAFSELFSLSVYNDLGYGYLLDRNGSILCQSRAGYGGVEGNIFDVIADLGCSQEDAAVFRSALSSNEAGNAILTLDSGSLYAYSYIPLESAPGWYLLSIVPLETVETDVGKMMAAIEMSWVTLLILLVICGVLFLLTRNINKEIEIRGKDIAEKDRELAAKDKDIEEKAERLEYEARMFEAFAACLSNSSNDVYLILNEDREVIYATPNLEQMTGRSQEEIAASFRGGGSSTDTEEVQEFLRQLRTLSPGESIGPVIREQIYAPTGERQHLLARATCVRIQGRVKVVVYVSDRTREYKLREDLVDALRRAQDANSAKSVFLKNVSHDMRTPMNAIIGFLGLMRDEVNNPSIVMEYNQQLRTWNQ